MKIHGWCEKCRKIKRVTVRIPRHGAVQIGVCDACQDKK